MYKVGKIYEEFISNREGIIANLSDEGLLLKFLWKNPYENIINSINCEPFFQLYFKNDIMFLLIKFSDLKWIDIPCVFTENVKNFFSTDFVEFPVKIILVNSNTGKVFAVNNHNLPEGITKAFIQNIHTQKNISKKSAIEKINKIRSSFSASDMSLLSLGKT